MKIEDFEETRPNEPNFLLVVGLFCATILIVFVVAYAFVDFEGGHLTFRHHRAHPTSELRLPGAEAPPA
jgi:hypothetical protein